MHNGMYYLHNTAGHDAWWSEYNLSKGSATGNRASNQTTTGTSAGANTNDAKPIVTQDKLRHRQKWIFPNRFVWPYVLKHEYHPTEVAERIWPGACQDSGKD